ncbi:MAG: GNAT family N-acetyltransferase [Leptolyngbya sp. SIO1D8]|nr:GNAT family N-acetyltransferase [Leptolyngbya sp. SIO1D8]
MTIPIPRLALKPAAEADLPLLQQWLAQNRLPTEDIAQIWHCLYLAMCPAGETVVGIGGIERCNQDGLLRSLVIAAPFRQQGYGQQLCHQLIDQAKQEGIQTLYLLTNTAEQFFAKLGFQVLERQAAPVALKRTAEFSRLCPDSAVCMRLSLSATSTSVSGL